MSINDRVFQAVLDRGLRPEDFAKGAQENANSAWLFGVISAGLIFFLDNWMWAIPTTILTAWSIYRSMSATKMQMRLEKYFSERQ